jgi:MoxR-like ATPase
VILTSNGTRQLSEALKRRCLFLHLGYPTPDREKQIIRRHLPGISDRLNSQIADTVMTLRGLDLRKRPSISESLDWARTLLLLAEQDVSGPVLAATLHVLLKNQSDIERASEQFDLAPPENAA